MATAKQQAISTNNMIAAAVLVSLVAILVSGFASKALVSKLAQNNSLIGKKATADDVLKKNLEAAHELETEYQALGSQKDLILNSLPIKIDFGGLGSSLEQIAGISGLKIKSVAPEAVVSTPVVATTTTQSTTASQATQLAQPVAPAPVPWQFGARVEGNYESLIKFLAFLEISARPIKVNSMKITGTDTALAADLVLTSFSQGKADLSPRTEVLK